MVNYYRSTINDCKKVELPIVHKDNGNITAINGGAHVPFDVERVYYLYDIPGGEERGGHAHKQLHQLITAASGAFDVVISDGLSTRIERLDRPYLGLMIVPGIWRELINFSSGAICLVLASAKYTEKDYIRDFETFKSLKSLSIKNK